MASDTAGSLHDSLSVADILQSATLALTRTLDLDIVLATLLEYLGQLVPYDTANVMLRVSDSRVAVRALRGYERWTDPAFIRAISYDIHSDPSMQRIAALGGGFVIADTSMFEGWIPTPGTEHVLSWLCVPLLDGDELIGLYSVDKAEAGFFTETHLRLAESLAPHAVVAIQNARLHDQVQRQKEVLERIIDNVPVILSFFDAAGEFQLVNREWERVLGWSLAEMRSRDMLAELFPDPAQRQDIRMHMEAASGWREFQTHVRDGRVIDALWAHVHLSDGSSIGIGQDITDRKRLEAQFRQAQKMESVGRLAGGIAHDFNNLLTVISGYSETALDNLTPQEQIYNDLAAIRQAADRAASLTHQLLAFARKQIIRPQVIDLNDLVVDMERLFRRLIDEDIELAILLAPALAPVKVDPHQIEQVLTNLVVNARDAMPNGGKLVIETKNVVLEDFFVREHAGASYGRHVMLAVNDSGIGMDMATQTHLFEPFFTTKGPGKGTGLGLATCYGIVKQHGGYIECYSKVGFGTSIRVYLPSLELEAPPAPQPNRENIMPHGTETILLVEDDIAVRGLTARLLTRLGYAVIEAVNGLEALRVVQSPNGRAIDLVITDVVMPQMGGKMLATRLAELRPELPVLFMSGYTDDALVEQGCPTPSIAFIQKPFSQAGLAYKVREALDP